MATEKPDPKNGAADKPPPANVMISSSAVRAHLECTAGPEKGQKFRIAPGATVIGRDAACEVALTETVISRQHCRIERQGEGWILRNLSSNGTLLNKKSVDEAPLADGDDIRIGAKTRLMFVIEQAAATAGGRPQFRARTMGATVEEEAAKVKAEDAEAAAEAEAGGKPSLFKRRKGLFIGLGVYLALLLGVAVFLTLKGPGTIGPRTVPELAADDVVYLADGTGGLRIVRRNPDGSVLGEDPAGGQKLFPAEDIRSGKAYTVDGIRKSLDVKFGNLQPNEAVADQLIRDAKEQYRLARLPGHDSALYSANRLFQKALGYMGTGYIVGKPDEERIRQEALKELIDRVTSTYKDAVLFERAGDYKQARLKYEALLRMVPDDKNMVFRNVSRRLDTLKRTHPEKK